MKELSSECLEEVNGGVVALYWVVKGGIWAYRASGTVRFISNSMAGGYLYEKATG
ncbi:hypothetical protein KJ365_11285 [Glaciecola sp. XM2]|jgi:hypothetical protein|uniref:hypothetical protein n=1 Tax=Glaciecola sp. XM2 TaxID=1914931 RepID=UPI001BDDD1BD|nr:hypothetical protein [Glaciecola sp. XM2]MBT1451462.1 hypothetical protein [Glaciecola sp. XM2]